MTISIQHSEIILTKLMKSSYANLAGKIHSGVIQSLMNNISYVTATKHKSFQIIF